MDFRMMMRRYGPAVHLTPTGELDAETRAALDDVLHGLNGVSVVACDMGHLTFMDVTGLHGLTVFVRRLSARDILFFAYNWQPQPLRLMDLVDGLYRGTGRATEQGAPTALLRRALRESASAQRAVGAVWAARDDALRGVQSRPR
ncbi:STAS domain-containing protein [Streptomyces xanthophaeus]